MVGKTILPLLAIDPDHCLDRHEYKPLRHPGLCYRISSARQRGSDREDVRKTTTCSRHVQMYRHRLQTSMEMKRAT